MNHAYYGQSMLNLQAQELQAFGLTGVVVGVDVHVGQQPVEQRTARRHHTVRELTQPHMKHMEHIKIGPFSNF
jgi:hypothetical protein